MAEHKKLSMLVKLDDGQTYTLGGDSADNAVTLDTEQTITGLKTFDKLPQSSVEPKADADLITKGYADGHYLPVDTKPHKYDILVKMKHDGTSWVGFSDFSVRLRDGTRLDVKHIENQSATTATQPVKAVFKTVKDLNAPIEAPTQQAATFFDSYSLEAGEFTGTVSFYKVVGNFGPASYDIKPWYVYVGSGNANNYDGIYAVSIDNLDKPLLGVNFKFGDAHTSSSYTCLQCGVVFTVDGSALEVAYDGDMSNAFETTIEYPINAQSMIGVVKVDNAQEITGAKTFTQNIKVTAKPKEATDVATVGYVSGLLNAKAPYDVTLDFKVEDDTDGGWVVYSNMEINLDNGKKLKCIHIDNTQPTSANAPVKAVFKAIPATEAINAAPTEQAPTFFDTYQLQDEEYLGTLTYGHILNSQLQDYASYKGPFHTNQYGTTCTIKEATQLRISISELPAAVSKVSLKFDSSYLPKTFKASLSGVGMDVTSNVLTNPSGNTPLELLFDIVKLTGLVTLDTAQTITGAKTFEKLPKSEATPVDDHELVNKAYVDSLHPKKETSLTIFGSFFDNKSDGGSWISYSDLKISLLNGAHLVPIYLENTAASRATEPVKVIFKVSNTPYVANSVQAQAKDWFDTYVLKENECLGFISYASVLDVENVDSHQYANLSRPFDEMLVKRVKDLVDMHGEYPMIKFTVEGLPAKFSTVNITIATPNYTSNPPYSLYVLATDGDNSYKSRVYNKDDDNFSADASHLTKLSIPIGLADPSLVTLHTQQELTALKTFKVLPQSEAVPADDKDLVNKKYVDEKVGAGGGTGGAAPANMVTTDTAQNITEVKTFDKLPKSSVEPTDDTELVNKKYVDDASKTVVTLADAQTITGVKTFSALPQSSVEPATDTDLVNKKYVDAKVGGGGAAGGNVMTLDTEQTVTAVKTFNTAPNIGVLPTDKKHAVNVDYLSKVFAQKGSCDVELLISVGVGMNHSGSGYFNLGSLSYPKIQLENGKWLKFIYADNTTASKVTNKLKAVYKLVDSLEQFPEADVKPTSFFDSYHLQEGEYLCEYTFPKQLDPVWEADALGDAPGCPFYYSLQFNNNTDTKVRPFFKIEFKGLPAPIRECLLSAYMEGGVTKNSKTYAKMTIGSFSTEYKLDQPLAEPTTFPLLSLECYEFVSTNIAQTISALKTFTALPQSEATPADEKDLVTKKFLDSAIAELDQRIKALEAATI